MSEAGLSRQPQKDEQNDQQKLTPTIIIHTTDADYHDTRGGTSPGRLRLVLVHCA